MRAAQLLCKLSDKCVHFGNQYLVGDCFRTSVQCCTEVISGTGVLEAQDALILTNLVQQVLSL